MQNFAKHSTRIATLFGLLALSCASVNAQLIQLGSRPEIKKLEAPATGKAGEAVNITVSATEGSAWCGLLLEYGDGNTDQIKINDENKFPVTVSHTYAKGGKYTIKASGVDITTHKNCKSDASSKIVISAPKKAVKSKPAAAPAKPAETK